MLQTVQSRQNKFLTFIASCDKFPLSNFALTIIMALSSSILASFAEDLIADGKFDIRETLKIVKPVPMFLFLIILTYRLFAFIQKDVKKCWDQHLEIDKQHWDIFLKDKQIVLNIDMTKLYDSKHIEDMKKRLDTAFPAVSTSYASGTSILYAVDATSLRTWWSNSMLGYLAVQAKWKSEDTPPRYTRQIKRIFVMHPLEMTNPLGKKIISLHRLFGFDTYVVTLNNFRKIYYEIKTKPYFASKSWFNTKEFAVWDNCGQQCTPENLGYRSYWNIDTPEDKREEETDFDGDCARNHKIIKFRNYDSEEEAQCYLAFFKEIIRYEKPCKTDEFIESNIRKWSSGNVVLKIEADNTDEIGKILDIFSKHYEGKNAI